jgi:hypothetical protein
MELAAPGGLPMGLSSPASITAKGLGTAHQAFSRGDTKDPNKKPLIAKAAPRRLERPNTNSSNSTTAASPPWVRNIHRFSGPIGMAWTASNQSRFKSECHTPHAKSSSTVATPKARNWLRADNCGAELNNGRTAAFVAHTIPTTD